MSRRAQVGRFFALACVAAIAAGCGRDAAENEAKLQQIAALQQRIEELQTEAEKVEAVSAVRRLQRAYGYYVDSAQWDQVADLFADDGSIEIGLDGVYSGKERIRKYLMTLGGGQIGLRQGELNEHMQLQPFVTVADDGQSAKGRWRAFIMIGEHGKRALWGEGPYENEYVKQDGVWKIKKVHWYQTFLVPYAGGWSKNKDVNGGIFVSKELPPDSPPSEKYEVWPNVYIPPYHYKNPGLDAPLTEAAPAAAEPTDPAVAELARTVNELARRVERLKDVDAIENLVSAYGYYLDKQQWDDFVQLFAADSTMEISQRGIYVGKPSIRKAMLLFGPQNIEPNHLHNHMQLQPVIHVAEDGKTAKVRSRAFSQLGTFGRPGVWMGGVYENELVKENGVWKFKLDHVYTTYFADYDKGWTHGPRGTAKPSDKIPPDRPASVAYEAFPDIYIPPFHYPNPVTGQPVVLPAQAAATQDSEGKQ